MRLRWIAATCVLLLVPVAGAPAAGPGPGGDAGPPPVRVSAKAQTDAVAAALDLARKANLLLQLGSYSPAEAQPLDDAISGLGFPTTTSRAVLTRLLAQADAKGTRDLSRLQNDGVRVSPDVQRSLAALSVLDRADAAAGRAIGLSWQHMNAALDDLVNRAGQPPTATSRRPPDPAQISDALTAANGGRAPLADRPAPSGGGSGSPTLLIVLVAVGLMLAAALAAILGRRRRSHPAADLEELLDVGRRLAQITAAHQIHRALLREAMGLVRAHTGAVVLRDGDGLTVGHEGERGLLVRDRLLEGAIGRVAETGQPLAQVSANEPAIRNLPVALVSVPLIVSGSVSAVLVLVRPDDDPFTAAERDLLAALAPTAASAMLAAQRAATAMEQSLADPLTGVGNRRRLDADVAAMLADVKRRPTALLMIDLDRFKSINDGHGHVAGDSVLRAAVDVMLATLRPLDAVYRYGGEEFAVLLPSTTLAEATEIAERVRAAVGAADLPLGDGQMLHATVSVGVAVAEPGAAVAPEELVSRADEALYQAKASGRNRVCVGELQPATG